MKDGKIRNAQISEGLLAILGLRSLKEIPMEKAGGSFTIGGGAINLKSVIANKDLIVNETGTIGLDQRLDMSLLVKVSDALSPMIVSQSGVSQFLSGEKGLDHGPSQARRHDLQTLLRHRYEYRGEAGDG